MRIKHTDDGTDNNFLIASDLNNVCRAFSCSRISRIWDRLKYQSVTFMHTRCIIMVHKLDNTLVVGIK